MILIGRQKLFLEFIVNKMWQNSEKYPSWHLHIFYSVWTTIQNQKNTQLSIERSTKQQIFAQRNLINWKKVDKLIF